MLFINFVKFCKNLFEEKLGKKLRKPFFNFLIKNTLYQVMINTDDHHFVIHRKKKEHYMLKKTVPNYSCKSVYFVLLIAIFKVCPTCACWVVGLAEGRYPEKMCGFFIIM